jgi:hypothetical protein
MTTTPNFDDLTPPDELMENFSSPAQLAIKKAARWGARHGWEQARQLWPEPIQDRKPTRADADRDGFIQFLDTWNHWSPMGIEAALNNPPPAWMHTVNWQPQQPSLQEQAIARLAGTDCLEHPLTERDRDLIRRALEQAGEGVA